MVSQSNHDMWKTVLHKISAGLFTAVFLLTIAACAPHLSIRKVIFEGGAAEDVSHPDLAPGPEKKSAPYVVDGKKYYPLKTAVGFTQSGVASWYGPDFDGKSTANGETYDQMKMTAAHKTLPFNTLLKVKNFDAGQSVLVRINDRGPFVDDRIIDLSRKAAMELGMIEKGTAYVKITAVSRGGAKHSFKTYSGIGKKRQTKAVYDDGNVWVQTGSFSKLQKAVDFKNNVQGGYGEATVSPKSAPGGRTLYRVLLGPFSTLADAETAVRRFKAETGVGAFVVIEP